MYCYRWFWRAGVLLLTFVSRQPLRVSQICVVRRAVDTTYWAVFIPQLSYWKWLCGHLIPGSVPVAILTDGTGSSHISILFSGSPNSNAFGRHFNYWRQAHTVHCKSMDVHGFVWSAPGTHLTISPFFALEHMSGHLYPASLLDFSPPEVNALPSLLQHRKFPFRHKYYQRSHSLGE